MQCDEHCRNHRTLFDFNGATYWRLHAKLAGDLEPRRRTTLKVSIENTPGFAVGDEYNGVLVITFLDEGIGQFGGIALRGGRGFGMGHFLLPSMGFRAGGAAIRVKRAPVSRPGFLL
jgi:hypothetical protein